MCGGGVEGGSVLIDACLWVCSPENDLWAAALSRMSFANASVSPAGHGNKRILFVCSNCALWLDLFLWK